MIDQVERCHLAQAQANGLGKSGLGNIEYQQHRSDLKEDQQLLDEFVKLAIAYRVIEWFIPGIELDLEVNGCTYDADQANSQEVEPIPALCVVERISEACQLPKEIRPPHLV
jgi:hypothetical protein